MPRIHETLSGHEIRYDDPTPEVEAFLRRAVELAADPKVPERDLVEAVYSRENPILDHTLFPGRGAVTPDVFANPLYHVLLDLLFRKEVQQRKVDVEAIAARYTLTVDEAAARVGVHPTSITKAISERRVGSWYRDGRYWLDPNGLASLQRAPRRGPAPRDVAPLEYRVGQGGGAQLRLKYSERGEPTEPPSKREPVTGELRRWRRVAVLHGRAGKLRLFVLEPAPEAGELVVGDFYVRGSFKTVEKVNNAKRAEEAWEAFQPA
jgi:hypothetical protein